MKRVEITPRKDWQSKVEALGFSFHTLGDVYWDESAYYSFTMNEILTLEKATNELHELCLDTVQQIIDHNLYSQLCIPDEFIPIILRSWNEDEPSIYGRFDFRFDGNGVPKMLEYNADTPTSLLESSVVQWHWLQDFNQHADQFNSIHEKLIAYWTELKPYFGVRRVYFASVSDNTEDIITTEYMRDTAIQAGLLTEYIAVEDIGWNGSSNEFTDLNEDSIKNIFKLYPWEWLIHEEFGQNLLKDINKAYWIEPAWKMIVSNKGFLPILYRMHKSCPYLLPAYFDSESHSLSDYARKPIFSREGANIDLIKQNKLLAGSGGEYGEEGFIVQQLCELPNFNQNYPVIGSWVIGGEAAGIGIRESNTLITTNTSRFVPHLIEG